MPKNDLDRFSVMIRLAEFQGGIHDPRDLFPDAQFRNALQRLTAAIRQGQVDPQRFPSVTVAGDARRRFESQVHCNEGAYFIAGEREECFIPPRAAAFTPATIRRKTERLREALMDAIQTLEPPFTVRNVYYALVSLYADQYPKSKKTYAKVKEQLVFLRREGVIAHGDIIDTSRRCIAYRTDQSVNRLLAGAGGSYNPSHWADQDHLVQIWTEKDTVSGLLDPVVSQYQIPLFVARGFGSESFIYRAAQAIKRAGKPTTILYVGDHDPSGAYMPAFLIGALRRLLGEDDGLLDYRRLAVLPSQALTALSRYGRSPNREDSRYFSFAKIYGSDAEAVEDLTGLDWEAFEPWP